MPDQLGHPCPDHSAPGFRCFCDEARDLAAGIHRPGTLADAFGGYQCICGDLMCLGGRRPFTTSPGPAAATTTKDAPRQWATTTSTTGWWPKCRRYRLAGRIVETIGWLLVVAGTIGAATALNWWILVGLALQPISWRLHRTAEEECIHGGEVGDG
jgi:hypothetical protein